MNNSSQLKRILIDLLMVGVITIGLLQTTVVAAQAITIFGGSSIASECYQRSQLAVLANSAGRDDLEVCDRAIIEGKLGNRDLASTYVNRGIIHTALDQLDNAARDYNKAIKLAKDTGEAYVNRGNLWFVAGYLKEAIKDYNQALGYDIVKPHVAHLNRGMAYENLGDLDAAKTDYLAAQEFAPEWPIPQQRLERLK